MHAPCTAHYRRARRFVASLLRRFLHIDTVLIAADRPESGPDGPSYVHSFVREIWGRLRSGNEVMGSSIPISI